MFQLKVEDKENVQKFNKQSIVKPPRHDQSKKINNNPTHSSGGGLLSSVNRTAGQPATSCPTKVVQK